MRAGGETKTGAVRPAESRRRGAAIRQVPNNSCKNGRRKKKKSGCRFAARPFDY
jgi:hypothetical protein